MESPTPLRSYCDGPEAAAGELLERVRGGEPWPADRRASMRWAISRRILDPSLPPRRRRAACAAAAIAAACAAAAYLVWPSSPVPPGPQETAAAAAASQPSAPSVPWSRLDLPDLGTIEAAVEEGFQVQETPQERQLRIVRGTLRVQVLRQDPARPVVVITPHLKAVVVGTRFDVHSDARESSVQVLEGRVRVEGPDGSALLEGGMSIRSGDPRLRRDSAGRSAAVPSEAFEALPPPTDAAPPPAAPRPRAAKRSAAPLTAATCQRLWDAAAQRRCYEKLAKGHDLAAQAALFALGELARDREGRGDVAAEHFRAYLERFPQGILAPEAALGLLEVLKGQGDTEAAIAAAEQFLRLHGEDARAPEVTLVWVELSCRDLARRARALEALAAFPDAAGPVLEDHLARVRAHCERASLRPGGAPAPDD